MKSGCLLKEKSNDLDVNQIAFQAGHLQNILIDPILQRFADHIHVGSVFRFDFRHNV